MILLGIILLVLAVGLGTALLTAPEMTDRVELDVLGVSLGLNVAQILVVGAVLVLMVWLGLLLIRHGAARAGRLRRQRKEDARLAEEHRQAMEREASEKVREQRLATDSARERAEVDEGDVEDLEGRRDATEDTSDDLHRDTYDDDPHRDSDTHHH